MHVQVSDALHKKLKALEEDKREVEAKRDILKSDVSAIERELESYKKMV